MPIRFRHGDVLNADAHAIILTTSPDSLGEMSTNFGVDHALGNTARQFSRKWPSAWEEVLYFLKNSGNSVSSLKIPGGNLYIPVKDDKCPFRAVEMISTLSHQAGADMFKIGRRGFTSGLRQLFSRNELSIATTPPRGGWRLDLNASFRILVESLRESGSTLSNEQIANIDLQVWSTNQADIAQFEILLSRL
jgi:hypothetical protein